MLLRLGGLGLLLHIDVLLLELTHNLLETLNTVVGGLHLGLGAGEFLLLVLESLLELQALLGNRSIGSRRLLGQRVLLGGHLGQ